MSPSLLLPFKQTSWSTAPWFQKWALRFLIALAIFEGIWTTAFRDNDFLCHRQHGERFLQRQFERDHYPPGRALMNAALALAPYRLTRAIVYCLALAGLLACYRIWSGLAARTNQPGAQATGATTRAAAMLAVILLLPYVIRDLDECGLQLILLFLLTMAAWALSRGKSVQTGFWLGTAVCYKMTPLLFLPFLLWKRQWSAAASMAVFFLLWCAAPALYSGWQHNLEAHKMWLAEMQHLKESHQAYPSLGDREPPKIYNMSVQAAIARYLEIYPPGHPLYIDHPCFLQFGNLSSDAAYYTLQGILACLGLAFAWKTRRPWQETAGSAFTGEWAVVCLMCALLSPSCWKQHVVLILPCMFLMIRQFIATNALRGWRLALLGGCVGLMCLCPGPSFFLGDDVSAVLHSYKLHTLGATTVLLWTLANAGRVQQLTAAVASGAKLLKRVA